MGTYTPEKLREMAGYFNREFPESAALIARGTPTVKIYWGEFFAPLGEEVEKGYLSIHLGLHVTGEDGGFIGARTPLVFRGDYWEVQGKLDYFLALLPKSVNVEICTGS